MDVFLQGYNSNTMIYTGILSQWYIFRIFQTFFVSMQFLHLQILTFDKSLIPTLARSCMEIASLPLTPLYSYPPYNSTIKTNMGKNKKQL